MPEVITIMSGAIAQYSAPKSVPYASFNIPEHEGLVTLTVNGTSIGDNYARYAMVRLDGIELKGYRQWVVSKSFTYTAQLDLIPGTHVLEVEVTSYVGYWEINATAEYEAIAVPTLPPVITDSTISTISIAEGTPKIIFATAEDVDPSAYKITVDGVLHDSGSWPISPMTLQYNCVNLSEGTHNIVFRFEDQSGLHSIKNITVVVAAGEGNGDNGIGDIDILPAIILTGIGIVASVGSWFLTDGFTKIPDPSQFFAGIQLPELKLPF